MKLPNIIYNIIILLIKKSNLAFIIRFIYKNISKNIYKVLINKIYKI